MSEERDVVIAGAGMGGLLLGHALKNAGFNVGIYEREQQQDSRFQGYRFGLADWGLNAIKASVPAAKYRDLECLLDSPDRAGALRLVDSKNLKSYWDWSDVPADPLYRLIPRFMFRDFLMGGVEDNVHYGKNFDSFETFDDPSNARRRVRVKFEDGSYVVADALIGCDGANSHVRRAVNLDNKVLTDIASVQVHCKITPEDFESLPEDARNRMSMFLLPDGLVGFFSTYFPLKRDENGYRNHDAPLTVENIDWDYTDAYFAILGDKTVLAEKLEVPDIASKDIDGQKCKATTISILKEADVDARMMFVVENAIPGQAQVLPMASCARTPEGWSATNGNAPVILIGDALHAMLPTRGMGGNLALTDAGDVAKTLIDWKDSGRKGSLPAALKTLEDKIKVRGFQWVGSSAFWCRQYTIGCKILDEYKNTEVESREEMERRSPGYGYPDNASAEALRGIAKIGVAH